MAEFEIIGEKEDMDEATRAFLQQEQEHMAALGQPPAQGAFSGFENDTGAFGSNDGAASNPFGDESFGTAQGGLDDWQQGGSFDGAGHDADFMPPPPPESSDPYAAISSVDTQMGEPEALRVWRDEQAARLAEKDAQSAQGLAALKAKAQDDLATLYRNYDEQKLAQRAANKDAQKDVAPAEVAVAADWETVCSMCDFNPKTAKGQRDTSRLRGILLQLKQSPLVR
eukprot:comp22100_c0_seq1/m.32246 comp22100_c0_seq1/g.32246  ORF comp22100_c0_seq1/g.32246 comp22100_c0_seq1/m.32246 type:complete len:226 (-) comp22100_c0_seq1:87-764(-)